MKTFYKIRHTPSGLFYKPSKYGSKVNLSKEGKTYNRMPSWQYIMGPIRLRYNPEYKNMPWKNRYSHNISEFIEEDFIPENWEIVRYEVVEAETIPYSE